MDSSASVQGPEVGPELLRAPACLHQWVIEAPAGRTSKGVCRLCGEDRDFLNYIEGSSWGYDVSLEQLAGGSRFPTKKEVGSPKDLDEEEAD